MSDFLVNLLRRGAGLPPVVAPRLPGLPQEIGDSDEERDVQDEVSRPALQPQTDLVSATEPQRLRADRLVSRRTGAETALPRDRGDAVSTTEVANTVSRVADRSESLPPAMTPRIAPPSNENSSEPVRKPQKRPVPKLVPPLPPSDMPIPFPAPIGTPTAAKAVLAPSVMAPVRSPSAARPSMVLIEPVPATAAVGANTGHEQPPRIEVRIGRIDIQTSPAPQPPTPARRRAPRGFQEHALARRYLDRRRY